MPDLSLGYFIVASLLLFYDIYSFTRFSAPFIIGIFPLIFFLILIVMLSIGYTPFPS